MNLTASNLLTCVLLAVLVILNNTTAATTQSICVISEGGSALVTTSSILTVLFIALDQYFAVVDPLRYRSRVDKVKCGLLITAAWIIAVIFASLAAFNPNPRSIWHSCEKQSNFTVQKFFNNFSNYLDIGDNNDDDYDFGKSLEELENTKAQIRAAFIEIPHNFDPTVLEFESTFKKINSNFTYGVVYSIGFGLFIYLIPFLTVCWIYIRIYSAARKNSERTRRTGSRPILSSGSFCEDYYPIKQENSTIVVEEIRSKIPKISSLLSVDENSEPSQMTRRKSSELMLSATIQIEDEKAIAATVIFTVGSQEVATKRYNERDNTKDASKVAPSFASLKAKFLENKTNQTDEQLKNKFPELNEQRRKSSHDLMYEEMIFKRKLSFINDSCEESSEDDEEMLSFITNKEIKVLNSFHNRTKEKLDIESQNNISSSTGEILIQNRRYLNVSSIPMTGKCNSKISLASASTESSSTTLLSAPQNTPIVTITPPYKIPLHRISSIRSTSSYINSLKYKISNGSIFKYREGTRAARISAIVIVMGLICWTPYVVVLIIGNFIDRNCLDLKNCNTTVLSFLVLATFVSPLLFGYRSKRVKRELRKFFCFRKELSYKNNRSLMAKKVLKRRHSGNLSQFKMESKHNILNYDYGKTKWPKDKVQFVQVPETALSVETCRSSFSSGASTQISLL